MRGGRSNVAIGFVVVALAANACFTFGDLSGDGSSSDAGSNGDAAATDGSNASDSQSTSNDSGPDTGARFCSTQSPPAGAADFFCADFDGVAVTEGLPDGSASVTDGGELSLTNVVAVSQPNALLSSVPPSSFPVEAAYLEWRKSGAAQLDSVTVTASINPTALNNMILEVGGTNLIVLKQANTTVYYEYSNGEQTSDADAYVGYIVMIEQVSGDIVFRDVFQVPTLRTELWTLVSLRFDLTTGAFTLKYDGTEVATATEQPTTDTTADVLFGAQNEGTSAGGNWRFDDVLISTTRRP